MRNRRAYLAAACAAAALAIQSAHAEDSPGVVVLDTSGFWRLHVTLRTPVVRDGDQLLKIGAPCDTPAPPGDWRSPDFDDSGWVRMPGAPFATWSHWDQAAKANAGFVGHHASSIALAQQSLRARFVVIDPKAADGLRLSVAYRGGVAVYVNGKELVRGHLPQGELDPETPAEMYPPEAHFAEDGRLLNSRKDGASDRLKLRIRALEDVAVPSALLRKGTNVMAMEIHRSPLPKESHEKLKGLKGHEIVDLLWDGCGLYSARLTAPAGAAVAPNATRPEGLQVWNASTMLPDSDLDWGDPAEELRPVRIIGARNGAFSGKVVVGSRSAIQGLKAEVTDLSGPGGSTIPASRVLVRYGAPDGNSGAAANYPASRTLFDALCESAPAEVPVRTGQITSSVRTLPGSPAPVFGAVVPVWVTVKVPADARGGVYAGSLAITAGGKKLTVPISLTVHEYALQAPGDFTTFVELVQSPDSLALRYGAELWSDRHWELIARSLALTGQLGARTCYVPLICETNHGNEQSMVRWVRDGGGGYRYDFSVMERYLDLVEKHQGRPSVVCFYVWDNFLEGGQFGGDIKYESDEVRRSRTEYQGKGPGVTVVDAGKVEMLVLPCYTEPGSAGLWAPLAKELAERMRKRGLEKAMALGVATDTMPTAEVIAFWKEQLPGVPWVSQAHPFRKELHGVPVLFSTGVWAPRFISYDGTSRHGWTRTSQNIQHPRNFTDSYPATSFRLLAEHNVGGDQLGFGRLGADFWAVLKDKRGNLTGRAYERYPKSNWRNLNIATALLGPGPEGPVATVRFEMLREGIQEAEARIFIERAIEAKKVPADVAGRLQNLIGDRNRAIVMGLSPHTIEGFVGVNDYERVHDWWNGPGRAGYYWYLVSGWQERSKALFDAAAEVQTKFGK